MIPQEQNFEKTKISQKINFCEEKIQDNTEKKIELTPKEIKTLILDVIKGNGWSESSEKIMKQIVKKD